MARWNATPRERFFSKVEQPAYGSSCWLWTAAKCSSGYGNFFFEGRVQQAHRASWLMFNGAIPDSLFVLHRCDNPACVNPDHFFLGDHQANADDKMAKGRHSEKNKTHCRRDHLLAGENLYRYKDGRRGCRECMRMRDRQYVLKNNPMAKPRARRTSYAFADGTTPADTHEYGVSQAASGASVQRGAA